jgi:MoxR-like ATPase
MSKISHYNEEYLASLQSEIYHDIVTGLVQPDEALPIMAGAQEYLQLRSRLLSWGQKFRNRWAIIQNLMRSTFKWGILMINGKAITAEQLIKDFAALDYVCDTAIADPVYLSLLLQKPLLIEGEPGVGKTEIAKVLAAVLNTELIRLQCYEGLDENKSLYEWNYQKQLLYIQGKERSLDDVFSQDFLMVRPLLKAILSEQAPVLLIDEIDKADEEFEAFLLEILSDFQVSIPEFGTIKARSIPHIIITNNDVRELTNALKRRCIYLYIDYPTIKKEQAILAKKVPGIKEPLARQIAELMNTLRSKVDLLKKPSIAEGIDCAQAVTLEGLDDISGDILDRFMPTILKNKEDLAMVRKRGGGKWLGGI